MAKSSSSAAPGAQLHYLSDHRSGCPERGHQSPPQATAGWAGRPWGPSRPRFECLSPPPRPGPPWTPATKGPGPSRLHGTSSYLQSETGRSEVAVARAAPGPQPPLPLRPSSPAPSTASAFLPCRLPNLPSRSPPPPPGVPFSSSPWDPTNSAVHLRPAGGAAGPSGWIRRSQRAVCSGAWAFMALLPGYTRGGLQNLCWDPVWSQSRRGGENRHGLGMLQQAPRTDSR